MTEEVTAEERHAWRAHSRLRDVAVRGVKGLDRYRDDVLTLSGSQRDRVDRAITDAAGNLEELVDFLDEMRPPAALYRVKDRP